MDIGKVLISGNQALNDRDNGKYNGKGGGIYAEGGDVTISGATITNNTAEQNGAGVMVGHNDKADHCTVNITGDTEIKTIMAVLAAVCTLRVTPNAASAETPKLKIIRLELPCGARRPPAVVLPL